MSNEVTRMTKRIMDILILNTDKQYTQDKYQELLQIDNEDSVHIGWQNDIVDSQIGLLSFEKELTNITFEISSLINVKKQNRITQNNIEYNFVRSVLAYDNLPDPHNPTKKVPKGNRKEASDVLYSNKLDSIPPNSVQPIWLSVYIPSNAEEGKYYGEISISADQLLEPINLDYEIEVLDAKLLEPQKYQKKFDVEFWQNPYIVAEYYEVKPFSDEHFDLLVPHMNLYKSMGGNSITATIVEEAWDGQTYSKNNIKFPSMVKWIKNIDGQFEFDYTDFDKWINFIKLLNLGDKIACYSLAPWTNSIFYTDERDAKLKEIPLDPGSREYEKIWGNFLEDFVQHVESLGIKNRIYIAIDERGLNEKIFKIIDNVKGSDGKPLKTAGALDSFIEKRDLSEYITDLTVGTLPIKEFPNEFKKLIEDRKSKGLRTTVYSCTEHIPGNFSLSEPVESYWTILFSYAVGGEGFLRWAYDSWVENPLEDTSHRLFEAGDTFLVYPDEKDAETPITKASIRLKKLAEGVRDVQKLNCLRSLTDEFDKRVTTLLSSLLTTYSSGELYLDIEGKSKLLKNIQQFKDDLNLLTKEAIDTGYSLDIPEQNKLIKSTKDIQESTLPKDYLSTVEKSPGTNRQYLGQPDMIMLKDDQTLFTVYPVGHGMGEIVMKFSDDAGETWVEKENISNGWSQSYETPTIYRLDCIDRTTKLIVISGRPNWGENPNGGWNTSISDDNGKTWSEYQTFHRLLKDGKENWSSVVMSSLIQLKDEEGNLEDRWLGVYHNEDFINYKTYLTFDEDGNENWSEPEPYLSNHRLKEELTQICEVCLVRSPDENVITAIARSQSHEHASVIFHSYDEGESWTEPEFLPLSLYGERHKAVYIPNTTKLAITFREIDLYENEEGEHIEWKAGNWVMWIGSYQDLVDSKSGDALLTLSEDYTQSEKSGDTGYAGLVVQSDGTLITNSYGHFDEEFSKNWTGSTTDDLTYIKQAKFNFNNIFETLID